MKITLETLYTPYTLDTYQTFTFDDVEEYILEREEKEYDDLDWTYDNKGYLEELAENWIILMQKNILDKVILSVEIDGEPASPKFYNFITDHAFIIFDVDKKALTNFIENNREDYNKNKIKSCDGFMWFGGENETQLAYYLKAVSEKNYTQDDYIIDQYEQAEPHEYVDYKIKK